MECKKCGKLEDNEMVIIRGSVYTGLYCKKCNSWLKRLNKQDMETIKFNRNIEVR